MAKQTEATNKTETASNTIPAVLLLEKNKQRLNNLFHTILTQEHIKTVYFDAKGNHFFDCSTHEGKKYSRLETEPKQVTKGDIKEWVAGYKANPDHAIVRELSRDEIIAAIPEDFEVID